jgi:hypothetical protein
MDNELKSSPLRVFSIYSNVNRVFKRKKIRDDDNLYKMLYTKIYNANSWSKPQCIRIFNEIENSFYSYRDLLLAMWYELMFNDKIQLNKLTDERVNEIKVLFTEEELKKDKKIILSINKNIIFNNITEYFKVNTENESYIYSFIKKKYISPIFWLKYGHLFDEVEQEYEESVEHIRFRKICKYMKCHY